MIERLISEGETVEDLDGASSMKHADNIGDFYWKLAQVYRSGQ